MANIELLEDDISIHTSARGDQALNTYWLRRLNHCAKDLRTTCIASGNIIFGC